MSKLKHTLPKILLAFTVFTLPIYLVLLQQKSLNHVTIILIPLALTTSLIYLVLYLKGNEKKQLLFALFVLSPMYALIIGIIYDQLTIAGLAGLLIGILFFTVFLADKALSKLSDYNPSHNKAARLLSLVALVLGTIISTLIILEKKIPSEIVDIRDTFLFRPLLLLSFLGTPLLIIIFGVKSLLLGKTYVKGVGTIYGAEARIKAILYILIGLAFLFMVLSFLYEVFICQASAAECSKNIFTQSWHFLTSILEKFTPSAPSPSL